jgi:hypothetical protein
MKVQLFTQMYNELFQYSFADYSYEDDQLIQEAINNDYLTDSIIDEVINNNEVYFKEASGLNQDQIDSLFN